MSIFGGSIKQVGSFSLYSYGSLLQEEEEWLDKQPAAKAKQGILAAKFITEIAKECKVSPQKVIKTLESLNGDNLDSKEATAILNRADELPAIIEAMSGSDSEEAAQVTMFLNSRLNLAWVQENLEAIMRELRLPKEAIYPVWTMAATRRLRRSLIVDVIKFVHEEIQAGIKVSGLESEPSEPLPTMADVVTAPSVEALGKSLPA